MNPALKHNLLIAFEGIDKLIAIGRAKDKNPQLMETLSDVRAMLVVATTNLDADLLEQALAMLEDVKDRWFA